MQVAGFRIGGETDLLNSNGIQYLKLVNMDEKIVW